MKLCMWVTHVQGVGFEIVSRKFHPQTKEKRLQSSHFGELKKKGKFIFASKKVDGKDLPFYFQATHLAKKCFLC